MRPRVEFCERSFRHVLAYGGARRTTLRDLENILMRYLYFNSPLTVAQ